MGEGPGAGGGGDVVGMGGVDLDVVHRLGVPGGPDADHAGGGPIGVTQNIAGPQIPGGGEAPALRVQGVGGGGDQLAAVGGHAYGVHVPVGERGGDRRGDRAAGVRIRRGDPAPRNPPTVCGPSPTDGPEGRLLVHVLPTGDDRAGQRPAAPGPARTQGETDVDNP